MKRFCMEPFWDLQLSWNSTNPDFWLCLEESVLVTLPHPLFCILAFYEFYKIYRSERKPLPWTVINFFKIFLTLTLCLITFVDELSIIYLYTTEQYSEYPVYFYTGLVKLVTFILVLIVQWYQRKKGICTSGVLFMFWLFLTIGCTLNFITVVQMVFSDEQRSSISVEYYVVKALSLPIIFSQFLLSCFSDKVLPDLSRRGPTKSCPETTSSFLSQITFSWFTSMARLGKKKPLGQKDMWDLDNDKKTIEILKQFEKQWSKQAQKMATKQQAIFASMLKAFAPELLIAAFCNFMSASFQLVNPIILDYLITFVSSDDPMWIGYCYAVALLVASALDSLFNAQHEALVNTVAMKMRSCIIATVYKKSLKVSTADQKNFTAGEIVNMMSVDTQKVFDFMQRINILWSAPYQISVCIYLLWQQLGVSTLAGLGVMILILPVSGYLTTRVRMYQIDVMKQKDKRSKLMDEILNGIKVIKLFSWEEFFQDLVMNIRNMEAKYLRKMCFVWGGIFFGFASLPFLVSLASFATFVLIDPKNVLDANKAFVSLSLFNLLRLPVNFLPTAVSFLAMAIISIKRINKYLNCEELDTSNVSRDANKTHAVIVDNGTFSWGKNQEPVLKDINWTVKHCKLVAVVGEVGVGKSSLLSAILGDLEKINGSVNISGSLAYVPQQAWILNETVRENILFSKKLDKNKYKQVLDACALESDLMILEGGDMCEIGEKGINLSGGQKQRVSLARAVYSDADIYLLDDPLSAVDSHVSKHLFDKVIGPKGMLKSKTRIIVTHRITILPQVDEIVVLKNGRISEQGTYSELLEKRGDFAEILVQHLDQEMEDVDDPQEIAVIEDLIETIKPTYERRRSCLSVSEDSFSVSVGRRGSWKMSSTASFTKPVVGRLIEEESSAVGSIKWFVYKEYFRSMGLKALIMIAVCYILSNSFNVSTSLWLTVWSNDAGDPSKSEDTVLRNSRLTIYSILGLGEILFVVIGTLYINLSCLRAAIYLHNEMLGKVLFAPMSFFDTTPLGRIQNRFTRDIDTADSTLNFNLRLYIVMLLRAIVTLLLISMETPLFILFIIPLAIAYNRIQNYYIITTRQLRRIESTTRSPIYTHLSETVNGTSCIRAYGVSGIFIRECYRRIDVHHSANYPSIVAARWLTVRLQFIGYIIVCLAAIFAVMSRGTLSAGIAGLTISYAMTMTGTLNFMVISSTELETNIVSVERCLEYNKVPVEAARRIESTKPTADWPERGCIRFLNYSTSYREGLNLVLKGVNFVVNPGEKVGVVGRTGAGKSSLTLALFRIIEPREGTIFIDDVDITTIGLHDLRSRLTIIPQDPVLFSGTVRMNLDPSGEVKDDLHLWTALDLANLGNYVRSLEAGLDHLISEKGENLSIGQRQLLCLARAIIRKSKILVLDEATAAVDVETDSLIQKAIREEFKECTVLTIAHRLNTVLDYDKILVLQAGEVMEYDAPAKLLLNKHSLFYGMAKDAGLV